MRRFLITTVGGAAVLGGVGAVGCGFVPGLDPWFDTKTCLLIGFTAGQILG